MKKTWQHCLAGVLLAGNLWGLGFAQDAAAPAARRGSSGFGFAAMLERTVSLTPEQSDAVRGLLAEQRRQSQSLREQTDTKIRALLKPEQQKKFDAFLAEQKNRRVSRKSNAA